MMMRYSSGLSSQSNCLHSVRFSRTMGKRERFVNTCCRNGQFEYLVGTFNKSFPAAVSWRWGTLIAQLDWVLDIEAKVKLAWNPARYGPAAAKKRRLNEESDFTRESVTSVLRDSRFWAWLHMCRKLQQGIERIVWWAESCPCHPCAFHDDGTRIARHHTEKSMWRKLVGERTLFTTCPLKGKRAPEAACGSILAKLREAYQVADVEVAAFCCHLDRGHHDEIMNDWNAGRRFVESLLTTKVAYWSSLPWHLCGIGHHDLAEARLCAKRCLVAYTARPNTEEHHRFTNQLLGVASPLRSDLEKFANGSPLCALSSDFQRKRCELKFVPIAERIIEGNTLWSSEPSPARTKSAAQSQFH